MKTRLRRSPSFCIEHNNISYIDKIKSWKFATRKKRSTKLKHNTNVGRMALKRPASVTGCTGGLMRGDGAREGWWGRVGAKAGTTVGATVDGFQPLRTVFHTITLQKFELKQCWKALRGLNAHWALPKYPVFDDEKSNGLDKEIGHAKKRIKRPTGLKLLQARFRANERPLCYLRKSKHHFF